VPLSEHEQRLLDQIEQALYAEDPKFVSSVRSVRARSHLRRSIVLAVVGFVLVVASCGLCVKAIRPRASISVASVAEAGRPSKAPRPAGLRSRMEERLRKRFDEN